MKLCLRLMRKKFSTERTNTTQLLNERQTVNYVKVICIFLNGKVGIGKLSEPSA